MKEITQKVVILNNFYSPYVKEAIIVLKDYNPALEGKAVADAERIVERYIEKLQQKNGQPYPAVRRHSKLIKFFTAAAVAALICISVKLLI